MQLFTIHQMCCYERGSSQRRLRPTTMRTRTAGFTLIELLVVIAVMAILALIALPTFQGKMVRDQIIEGADLAKIAKAPIAAIKGKVLTLRPAVVEDAPIVPMSWLCGHAPVPDKMTAKGQDKTDIPVALLPINCRAK